MLKLPELKIEPASEGELELSGELSAGEFESFRAPALKTLGQAIKLDGFRPGHVPAEVLTQQVGEGKILQEMAEQALAELYPLILTERQIAALGRPEVTITKLAPGNPLGFKFKTAVMPEVKLGDYQTIAKKLNSADNTQAGAIEIKDEAVMKVLEDLRKSRETASHASHSHHEHAEGEKGDTPEDSPLGAAQGESSGSVKLELNDDFAKSLGQFETLEELKAKIKSNLETEEQLKQKDKKRVAIIEEVIKNSDLKIAAILVENEKEKMLAEMEGQIGQMGLKFDDYLSHLKKTRDDLKAGWDQEARQRVAFGLVLNEIAAREKIEAPAEELKNEVDYLKLQYKDIAEERLRQYAAGLIVNEKVFNY
ncbi:MAG: hypothetical protein COV08_03460, partial [Candidatus Vogelbacteria bacterium CG10_big_fil_rev_8_21_14_0_10_49_38]